MKFASCLALNFKSIGHNFVLILQIFGPFGIELIFGDGSEIVCSGEDNTGIAISIFLGEDFWFRGLLFGDYIDDGWLFSFGCLCFYDVVFVIGTLDNNIEYFGISSDGFFCFHYLFDARDFGDLGCRGDDILNLLFFNFLWR